jgi:uncharacterized protein (TIGR03000 family)
MLNHHRTTWRPWRLAFGLSFLVLGLLEVGLPHGRAEIRYNGGYVQTRRNPNDSSPKQTAPKTTSPAAPRTTSSYSPDNDPAPSRVSTQGEAERPSSSSTGRLPAGLSALSLPWNRAGFEEYDDPVQRPRTTSVSQPEKYTLEVMTVRPQPLRAQMESASLIAHLPEHALLWVEGARTRLTGRTRYFQSPPLLPDRKYNYRVRVVWIEDGHWVSQTQTVPVEAGRIEAIYLHRRPR